MVVSSAYPSLASSRLMRLLQDSGNAGVCKHRCVVPDFDKSNIDQIA